MARHYRPKEKAKRDAAFLKHIAKKNNPIRSVMALPADLNLDDVDFGLNKQDRQWERLLEIKAAMNRGALAEMRRRAAENAKIIDEDERKAAEKAERERIETWWQAENEAGKALMEKLTAAYQEALDAPRYKELLKRLENAGKEINRDQIRAEKKLLLARGVVKGIGPNCRFITICH